MQTLLILYISSTGLIGAFTVTYTHVFFYLTHFRSHVLFTYTLEGVLGLSLYGLRNWSSPGLPERPSFAGYHVMLLS
jgi:hypothetical protein